MLIGALRVACPNFVHHPGQGLPTSERCTAFLVVYSGCAVLSHEVSQVAGFRVKTFDKQNRWFEDITNDDGYHRIIHLVCTTMVGGVVWIAMECAMYVRTSQSHYKRKRDEDGTTLTPQMKQKHDKADLMLERTAHLIILANYIDAQIVLENPVGSLVWDMREVLSDAVILFLFERMVSKKLYVAWLRPEERK